MKNYGKVLLYSYPKLTKLKTQLKSLAMDKAIASFYSEYDCERIAKDIIRLHDAENIIGETKEKMDKALGKFTKEEIEYFEHRYFKTQVVEKLKPKSDDRQYFRIQRKLFLKFMAYLERAGLTEEWFDKNCLKLRYFSDMSALYEEARL